MVRSWYIGRWWVGCYIWYSEEGTAATPPSPLLAVPNVTAHPSTVSLPITVLLYDGPLLCGFNVAIKGLSPRLQKWGLYATMLSIFVCSFVRLSPFHLLHLGFVFFPMAVRCAFIRRLLFVSWCEWGLVVSTLIHLFACHFGKRNMSRSV